MQIREILACVDHTLLRPTATWEEIRTLCDEGMTLHTASVCIPPAFVAQARDYLGDRLPVCTVIGFPNGNTTTATKVFEAQDAVRNGASELDMVIQIGWVKEAKFEELTEEIRQVRQVCPGNILKVIVETCLLTDSEKIRMCGIVREAGADYIKTSTGFSTGGATPQDVRLLAEHAPRGLKVKASGGIRSLADAEAFLRLGASRLGTSSAARWISASQIQENGGY